MTVWNSSVPICNEASCRDRCFTDHMLCDCRPGCEQYGRCCLDYETVCLRNKDLPSTHNVTDLIIGRARPVYAEVYLPMLFKDNTEGIVRTECEIGLSFCPQGYPADSIFRRKCEEKVAAGADTINIVPISTDTEFYKNIFCAACHGVDIQNDRYYPWGLSYACKDNTTLNGLRNKPHLLQSTPTDCSFVYKEPINKTITRRPCGRAIIDFCPKTFIGDDQTVHACSRYKDLVFTEMKIFKNRHCAQCHGVSFSDISCNVSVTLQWQQTHLKLFDHMLPLPDFSNLMNFVDHNERLQVHDRTENANNVYFATNNADKNYTLLKQLLNDEQQQYVITIRPEHSHCGGESIIDILKKSLSDASSNFLIEVNCPATFFEIFNISNNQTTLGICISRNNNSSTSLQSINNIMLDIQSIVSKALSSLSCEPIMTFDIYNHQRQMIDHCQIGAAVLHNVSTSLYSVLKDNVVRVGSENATYNLTSIPVKYREVTHLGSSTNIFDREMLVVICEHILENCSKHFINNSVIDNLINGNVYLTSFDIEIDRSMFEFRENGIILCSQVFRDLTRSRVATMSSFIKGIVSLVCIAISLGSLLVTFFVYCLLKSLRTIPGKSIMSLIVSLFFAQLAFELSYLASALETACLILAIVQHYLFLVSFAWMSILAWNLCANITSNTPSSTNTNSFTFIRYTLFAWGLPVFMVTLCICLDMFTTYGVGYGHSAGLCWLHGPRSVLYFVVVPLAVTLCFNVFFFTRTVVAIHTVAKNTDKAGISRKRSELVVYIKIASLMGFTWVFGFLSGSLPHDAFDYIFIIINGLHGFYILLAFVFRKSVLRLIMDAYSENKSKTVSTTKTSI